MPRPPRSRVDLRRRRLLLGLAAAPLAGAALPAALAATGPSSGQNPAPAPQPPKPGPDRADAEALLGVVKQRYGAFLEEEQLAEIRASIETQLRQGRQMTEAGLVNADEPDFVFSPYRSDD